MYSKNQLAFSKYPYIDSWARSVDHPRCKRLCIAPGRPSDRPYVHTDINMSVHVCRPTNQPTVKPRVLSAFNGRPTVLPNVSLLSIYGLVDWLPQWLFFYPLAVDRLYCQIFSYSLFAAQLTDFPNGYFYICWRSTTGSTFDLYQLQ